MSWQHTPEDQTVRIDHPYIEVAPGVSEAVAMDLGERAIDKKATS